MLIKRYHNSAERLFNTEFEFAGLICRTHPTRFWNSWYEGMMRQIIDFYYRLDKTSLNCITEQQPLFVRAYGLEEGEYMTGSIPLLDLRFDCAADIENFIELD